MFVADDCSRSGLSDAQQAFVESRMGCTTAPGQFPDTVFVYCYGELRVTRYHLADNGYVLSMQSFAAGNADRRRALAFKDPLTVELEALYRADAFQGDNR